MRRLAVHIAMLGLLLASPGASAMAESSSEPEPIGAVRALPAPPGPHWFWLTDLILHRTALFDADSGDMLGSISAGTAGVGFIVSPLFSPDRKEIYVAESYYSRGVRGDRTDVVTVYDGHTLQPLHEIAIPPKRAGTSPGTPRTHSPTTGASSPSST
jgi:methylamine dehydrogenase heavy chain